MSRKNKIHILKKWIKPAKISLLAMLVLYAGSLFIANIFYYKNNTKEISFLPKINFGIDIVGGNQLTIAIDTKDVIKTQLVSNKEFIESYCKDNKFECKIETKDTNLIVNVIQSIKKEIKNNPKILKDNKKQFIRQLRQILPLYELEVANNDNGDFTIEVNMTQKTHDAIIAETTDKAIAILKNRIDGVGVKEISVQRYGYDKIVILIPNGVNVDRIKSVIKTTAKLNFHLMDKMHIFYQKPPKIAKNHIIYPSYDTHNAYNTTLYYLMEEQPVLGGDSIANAQPNMDGLSIAINFRLNATGAKKFANITKNNVGKLLAIVLDEKVLMAPMINTPIVGGNGSITGNFTYQETQDLSVMLSSGSLPAKITIINERQLSSIFDKDVLSKASTSVIICFCLVGFILSLRYKHFGSIAFLALILNFLFTLTIISLFGFTLTLPGLAGFVLMLGMACDANILIYEKMKEYKKQGITQPETIIKNGFAKAIHTILDANITTIIAGIALFGFGGSFIKGFSITLIFGIICSIFTAVNITKMIINELYKNRKSLNI